MIIEVITIQTSAEVFKILLNAVIIGLTFNMSNPLTPHHHTLIQPWRHTHVIDIYQVPFLTKKHKKE
jgi:hypothetical protein